MLKFISNCGLNNFKTIRNLNLYKRMSNEAADVVSDLKKIESSSEKPNNAVKWKNKLEFKEEKKRALKLRRQAKLANKTAGFTNESLNQTEYYFENGLRKVYPYYFGWNTTAKERWFGLTIYEVYQKEFCRAIINQSLEKLIETGKIRVNGQIKSKDYIIKNGDRITHSKHRHEIPVLDDEIKFIFEDDDYLVVEKPCSIPMHPCGKYRYNSLCIILTKQFGYTNLRSMYRLDRLTSGVVVIGKNFKSASIIDRHIKDRTIIKTYVCRVVGEFPKEKITVNKAIDCASRKIGLYWVDDVNGKESITHFERISYNGSTSVVLCYPKTGRTHQIRIHLQYLGYPIVNDPLYNQPTVWGEGNGKDGLYGFTKEGLEENFLKIHTYEAWIIKQEQNETIEDQEGSENNIEETKEKNTSDKLFDDFSQQSHLQTDNDNYDKKRKIAETDQNNDNDEAIKKIKKENEENQGNDNKLEKSILFEKDDDCFECKQIYRDPKRKNLIMYLHALSYKFGDLEFKTQLPKWAEEDFIESE